MSKNAMRADLSRQMEKNNKSARTHPAYWQSWDTLLHSVFYGISKRLSR